MEKLTEKIFSRENLNKAYLQVYRNKGSQGIDGMTVYELKEYFRKNKDELIRNILDERYSLQSVLMVEIPKDNGKTRKLGIPTVVDRVFKLVPQRSAVAKSDFSKGKVLNLLYIHSHCFGFCLVWQTRPV